MRDVGKSGVDRPDDRMPEPNPHARDSEGGLSKGDVLGRFVVVGLLGRGGMGEVYAAYDPELDRKVAVKVLRARGDASPDAAMRLLREAQATARLQHPNVVVVYDVGTIGDGVFIAMEFVEGNTVGYWMQAQKRSPREVVGVFLAAGRGLVAAHDAGLVHRYFKPDNVMMSRDGQVRVMDFGLARAVGEPDASPAPEPSAADATHAPVVAAPADADMTATKDLKAAAGVPPPAHSGKYLQVKLTMTGTQMGTPAYMAPEQFLGTVTDARTDQFSFCVALYEALYGERPFAGNTFSELMGNVMMEGVRPAPADRRVPTWLRKVVLRGLRLDPRDRWPSMKELLAALEADPVAKRKRWLLGALVPVVLVAGAIATTRLAQQRVSPCAAGPSRVAAVWDAGAASPLRAAIERAFSATGKSYAAQAFAGAARLLDGYAGKWAAAYKDACEATNVRHEQSAEVLDLRMTCLNDRLTSLRAVTDVFTHADGTTVENAVGAAGAIPPVDSCADVKSLRAVVAPPTDPAKRAEVDRLRTELAAVVAERDAGHCRVAKEKSVDLLVRVRRDSYRPLLAETLIAIGGLANNCADASESLEVLRDAFLNATAARADEASAEAAALIPPVAARLGDVKIAREWVRIGEAALGRIGGNRRLEGWMATASSCTLAAEGNHEAAVIAEKRALNLKEALLGPDHLETILSMANVGSMLMDAGHLNEALAADQVALSRTSSTLGAEHPQAALVSNNLGELLNLMGRPTEAAAAFRRARHLAPRRDG
jgi:serine/threonine protein kinase/tetratricopeptide (TPR) repeat protein